MNAREARVLAQRAAGIRVQRQRYDVPERVTVRALSPGRASGFWRQWRKSALQSETPEPDPTPPPDDKPEDGGGDGS